jgi:hypothetical protein
MPCAPRAAAREWIEGHAAEHPALAAALQGPALWDQAEHVCKLWHRASEARVAQLRRSTAIRSQMALSHAHRSLVTILRAVLTQHDTFSTFLSEPLEGMQRWQSACCAGAACHPPPTDTLY